MASGTLVFGLFLSIAAGQDGGDFFSGGAPSRLQAAQVAAAARHQIFMPPFGFSPFANEVQRSSEGGQRRFMRRLEPMMRSMRGVFNPFPNPGGGRGDFFAQPTIEAAVVRPFPDDETPVFPQHNDFSSDAQMQQQLSNPFASSTVDSRTRRVDPLPRKPDLLTNLVEPDESAREMPESQRVAPYAWRPEYRPVSGTKPYRRPVISRGFGGPPTPPLPPSPPAVQDTPQGDFFNEGGDFFSTPVAGGPPEPIEPQSPDSSYQSHSPSRHQAFYSDNHRDDDEIIYEPSTTTARPYKPFSKRYRKYTRKPVSTTTRRPYTKPPKSTTRRPYPTRTNYSKPKKTVTPYRPPSMGSYFRDELRRMGENDMVGVYQTEDRQYRKLMQLDDGRRPCTHGSGYYANRFDCRRYYRCVDFQDDVEWRPFRVATDFTIFEFECGPKTVFSQRRSVCVHETQDNRHRCKKGISGGGGFKHKTTTYKTVVSAPQPKLVAPQPASSYGESASQGAPTCGAEGFYPHPDTCAQFAQCYRLSNGSLIGFFFKCPPGTFFDTRIPVCAEKRKVPDCGYDGRRTASPPGGRILTAVGRVREEQLSPPPVRRSRNAVQNGGFAQKHRSSGFRRLQSLRPSQFKRKPIEKRKSWTDRLRSGSRFLNQVARRILERSGRKLGFS